MRALTLTQPWAGLVAAGIKRIENRPRPMIKGADVLARPRVAIHASREIQEHVYHRIRDLAPELFAIGYTESLWYRLSRIKGAILSTHVLVNALYVGGCSAEGFALACARHDLAGQERWMFGPTCYALDDAFALETPMPCRGMLGFWTVPADIEAKVVAQHVRAA